MRECFSNLHAISNYPETTFLAIYDTCVTIITTVCQIDYVSGHHFCLQHLISMIKIMKGLWRQNTPQIFLKLCFLSSQNN